MLTYLQYMILFSPVYIGHIIIPPISVILHKEKPNPFFEYMYSIIPSSFLKLNHMLKYIFPLDSINREWIQWLSYLFLHSNYNHMIYNLMNTILFGYPIYQELGTVGLYTCYFTGGIISLIPSCLYQHQNEILHKRLNQIISFYNNKSPYLYSINDLPMSHRSFLQSYHYSIFKRIVMKQWDMKSHDGVRGYIGSSGATSALMGCSFVFLSQGLYFDLCSQRNHVNSSSSSFEAASSSSFEAASSSSFDASSSSSELSSSSSSSFEAASSSSFEAASSSSFEAASSSSFEAASSSSFEAASSSSFEAASSSSSFEAAALRISQYDYSSINKHMVNCDVTTTISTTAISSSTPTPANNHDIDIKLNTNRNHHDITDSIYTSRILTTALSIIARGWKLVQLNHIVKAFNEEWNHVYNKDLFTASSSSSSSSSIESSSSILSSLSSSSLSRNGSNSNNNSISYTNTAITCSMNNNTASTTNTNTTITTTCLDTILQSIIHWYPTSKRKDDNSIITACLIDMESIYVHHLINHAGHVQGIIYGVVFACVFGLMIPCLQRYHHHHYYYYHCNSNNNRKNQVTLSKEGKL